MLVELGCGLRLCRTGDLKSLVNFKFVSRDRRVILTKYSTLESSRKLLDLITDDINYGIVAYFSI